MFSSSAVAIGRQQEGECDLKSVHLQRVEGTPCQSRGCSHTGGSESLRSGSCIVKYKVTACGHSAAELLICS